MLTITEIQAKGEPAANSGRGGGNKGLVAPKRSGGGGNYVFGFHRQSSYTQRNFGFTADLKVMFFLNGG